MTKDDNNNIPKDRREVGEGLEYRESGRRSKGRKSKRSREWEIKEIKG